MGKLKINVDAYTTKNKGTEFGFRIHNNEENKVFSIFVSLIINNGHYRYIVAPDYLHYKTQSHYSAVFDKYQSLSCGSYVFWENIKKKYNSTSFYIFTYSYNIEH